MQWLSASQLVEYHRLCVIQKALITGLPPGITNQLTVAAHNHNTRSHGHLQRPRARTNAGKRRLCFGGASAYNRLPPELHQLSLGRFKHRLKEVLLAYVYWVLIDVCQLPCIDVGARVAVCASCRGMEV